MVRRHGRPAGGLFRDALIAEAEWIALHFPTAGAIEQVAALRTGSAVEASADRLFRGLWRIGATEQAHVFGHRGPGYGKTFRLDESDELAEAPEHPTRSTA